MLRSLSRLFLALLILGSLYAWMTDPSLAERFALWEWWLLPGIALGVSPLVAFLFIGRIQAEIKRQLRAGAEQPADH